ncbi:hypothetical protein PHAVU_001G030400 [Phaseolus vulgaris]|uniref:Uncharacterized protein n=2 Tax=Phaseolus vulgaris TaxID=3885 RepID=V7CS27_PHAVU|nr:hypothetical protein PHAVU_001G030400g [Phaseolus vulgaris]ESW32939.1 hypothetical protein PHAVU_001G030400g [Phaseolus vulgaris]
MEEVMTKLRNVAASTIQYSELLRICRETYESSDKDVAEMAKLLDHSGNVVVLGNSVLLHPEQISKRFLTDFKTKMSLEGASKAMSPPVVPHESSEDFLRRMMYHSQELPEAFNFAHEEKIRRAVLMKEVMTKLRNVTAIMIEYSEFLRICIETCENSDKGAELAKLLDHSRNVVFFGNHVILRPEEVAKLTMMGSSNQSIVNPIEQMGNQGFYFALGFFTLWFGIICRDLIVRM